ncbi:hypothetical protein F3Y22_tig00111166pilonHSYRG00088 [Hibiscus syriacus]|uniref:Uncharacterized protein n=1 Tax=Hibiscus syriacus TaxID=106335 RepID=A0A6A2YWD5_HIBSY|nr:hypothetical protein F3Y22_tig00111166pilonHSYRG00088 [Hibiscus syriacus]
MMLMLECHLAFLKKSTRSSHVMSMMMTLMFLLDLVDESQIASISHWHHAAHVYSPWCVSEEGEIIVRQKTKNSLALLMFIKHLNIDIAHKLTCSDAGCGSNIPSSLNQGRLDEISRVQHADYDTSPKDDSFQIPSLLDAVPRTRVSSSIGLAGKSHDIFVRVNHG